MNQSNGEIRQTLLEMNIRLHCLECRDHNSHVTENDDAILLPMNQAGAPAPGAPRNLGELNALVGQRLRNLETHYGLIVNGYIVAFSNKGAVVS